MTTTTTTTTMKMKMKMRIKLAKTWYDLARRHLHSVPAVSNTVQETKTMN
jgi:hypothetical protein